MIKTIKAKQQLWNTRRSSREQLKSMEPRMLRDMGITPADALTEIRKPFWRA